MKDISPSLNSRPSALRQNHAPLPMDGEAMSASLAASPSVPDAQPDGAGGRCPLWEGCPSSRIISPLLSGLSWAASHFWLVLVYHTDLLNTRAKCFFLLTVKSLGGKQSKTHESLKRSFPSVLGDARRSLQTGRSKGRGQRSHGAAHNVRVGRLNRPGRLSKGFRVAGSVERATIAQCLEEGGSSFFVAVRGIYEMASPASPGS